MTREWDNVFVCVFVVAAVVVGVLGFFFVCLFGFLFGTNGSIFKLLNSLLVCKRLPKTTAGYATRRLFLCSFKIDCMIVLFLFLFACFYTIFDCYF